MIADGLYLGLMSGTSMDGIDAALVRFHRERPELVQSHVHPWPRELQQRLRRLNASGTATLQELGELDHLCGALFADAARALLEKAGLEADAVTAIGSHGQTLRHHPAGPAPFTLQIGDPNLIAQRTGITTVADFRRRDLAAGGQGAPLVPRFHQAVFGRRGELRTVLNIGGIANLTVLDERGRVAAAFDTGPGNCLMDAWCRHAWKEPYDREGHRAAAGHSDQGLLERLLQDPYYRMPPPKSTGTEHFSLDHLQRQLQALPPLAPETVQATLLALSCTTVAEALKCWAPDTRELLVCGGGRHNPVLMDALAAALPELTVKGTESAGVDPDWVEAMAFAWLAAATLAGEPGNLPAATGARREVVLGGIYPA